LEKPIFILGCTKSGTTLLRNLFDGHEELFVIPSESHFFQNIEFWVSYFFRRTRPQNLTFEEMKQNLFEWVKCLNRKNSRVTDNFTAGKWNEEGFKEFLFSRKTESLKQLSDLYIESIYYSLHGQEYPQSLRFVEKSVENPEFALDWLKLYPDAKFIHILRNPYSNSVALRKYLNSKKYPFMKRTFLSMYNSYYFLYRNVRTIAPNQYKVVRYEDLIAESEKVMKELVNFLEIKYDDILTSPTLLGKEWGGNSTSLVTFKGISKINLEKWKKEISNFEIIMVNELFSHVIEDFNYESIDPNGSFYKIAYKESVKAYILNRLLYYYLPMFNDHN